MILLLIIVVLSSTLGQEYVIERLGGREGRIAPALGIKCSTAELKILNEMVEECLEIALALEVDDFELNDGGLISHLNILLICPLIRPGGHGQLLRGGGQHGVHQHQGCLHG